MTIEMQSRPELSAAEKSASSANVVAGFSKRFNAVMDRAGFPRENRVSEGARRFSVVHNTFKSWCTADKIPGSHAKLLEIIKALLKEIPGRHNVFAVVAWLLAGEAVPNPFEDDSDALELVELYLQIAQIAKQQDIEFDKFPREVRNLILKHIRKHIRETASINKRGVGEVFQLDDAAISMVIGMLETAQTMK